MRGCEKCVVTGDAQQAQAHHQHAGDGAALEGDLQRGVEAVVSRFGGAHVGAHRDVHADVAREAREDCADGEPAGRHPVERKPDGNEQHHTHDGDRGVLPVEVGLGTGLDGRRDVLHAGIAGGQLENRHHREHAVQNGDYAGANRQPQPRRGNHADSLRNQILSCSTRVPRPSPPPQKGAHYNNVSRSGQPDSGHDNVRHRYWLSRCSPPGDGGNQPTDAQGPQSARLQTPTAVWHAVPWRFSVVLPRVAVSEYCRQDLPFTSLPAPGTST